MKRFKLIFLLAPVVFFTSCSKTEIDDELDLPYGKWKSVAFFDGSSWVPIPTPHHFEFEENKDYYFRNHNGILCSGVISGTEVSGKVHINFQNSDCGLTNRIVEQLSKDTLELSVVNPPNVTYDKVKYSKE